MKTTKWAHLPNAKHIDWVLNSIKSRPDAWKGVRGAVLEHALAYEDAYNVMGWGEVETYNKAYDAAWAATSERAHVVPNSAWPGVRAVLIALIAYDDCSKYLDMTPDELEVWAALSNDPAAILLQPMVQAMQGELYETN